MDRWADAVRQLAERDRRTPEDLARAVDRGIRFVDAEWGTGLAGDATADLARDALALFVAGGGDAAGLLASVERLATRGGSPTVGERGQRAGTLRLVPADGLEGFRSTSASVVVRAADDGTGHEHAWPNPYTSCTCGAAPPDAEPRRRFYPDASRDPAWLDAEYTADD